MPSFVVGSLEDPIDYQITFARVTVDHTAVINQIGCVFWADDINNLVKSEEMKDPLDVLREMKAQLIIYPDPSLSPLSLALLQLHPSPFMRDSDQVWSISE